MPSNDRLKTVFITGAGKRLGRAMALYFGKMGWNVGVHFSSSYDGANQVVKMIDQIGEITNGQRGIALRADVRSKAQLESAFDACTRHFGAPPDVLVNNAGIFPPPAPISKITRASWDEVFSVNVAGEFVAAQLFSAIAPENARIINISSLGGLEVWNNRLPYNVSKSAVIHLTKALARELAPKISVNCICPGAISMPNEPSVSDASMIAPARIPMQRHGSAEDVCEAVYFFATCTQYITGQILTVDGGYHDAR
ncbi:MAG: SDR family oxidoreductase [Ignavibacteria bacterium]|nr:SDR family oxidoreductase [Ignavibacteria bacterium]